jgi:hypothetical protein
MSAIVNLDGFKPSSSYGPFDGESARWLLL